MVFRLELKSLGLIGGISFCAGPRNRFQASGTSLSPAPGVRGEVISFPAHHWARHQQAHQRAGAELELVARSRES